MPSYVVTGASRGIGLAFCRQLLARGDVVIALARQPDTSDGLKAIKNDRLHVVQADLTDAASLRAAADATSKITNGSLDVLINNAVYTSMDQFFKGIDQIHDPCTLADEFNTYWKTNVIGMMWVTNAFLPLLKNGKEKKVMTLSSGIGDSKFTLDSGIGYAAAYSTTKAASQMIVSKYAMSLKDEGFTFFSISPGAVQSKTAPPPPEVMPLMMNLFKDFQKAYPEYDGTILQPTDSVDRMLNILDNFQRKDTGQFISIFGGQKWL